MVFLLYFVRITTVFFLLAISSNVLYLLYVRIGFPSMITGVLGDDVQCTTVHLVWRSVDVNKGCRSQLSYVVRVRQPNGVVTNVTIDISLLITGLNSSTTYNITVAGRNCNGEGKSSNPIVITTLDRSNVTTPDGELDCILTMRLCKVEGSEAT